MPLDMSFPPAPKPQPSVVPNVPVPADRGAGRRNPLLRRVDLKEYIKAQNLDVHSVAKQLGIS